MTDVVSLDVINPLFCVYEIRHERSTIRYYGEPQVDAQTLYRSLWHHFNQKGYQIELKREHGEFVLVAHPAVEENERPYINLALAVVTALTVTITGATLFYGVNPLENPSQIYKGLPFAAAVMFVLGSHELAHYLMAKRRGMKASLPYFIPLPFISPVGTLGAMIKLKGAIPDRRSLFDVGISGPLVGLAASVVVTVIGLALPPISAGPQQEPTIALGVPLLFGLISQLVPSSSSVMHPIAFAGWIGMLITSLNLLPVGQLDGGHIARALSGEKTAYISAAIPLLLLATGTYYSLNGLNGETLMFWGFFALLFAAGGHPQPINDLKRLDAKRVILGIVAFCLCVACFTPLPLQA